MRYLEVRAAREWGLTPRQFDESDPVDKATMVAEMQVSGEIQAYEYQKQEEEIERVRTK